VNGTWVITAFTGTLTWYVPFDPDPSPGCAASLYQMQVSGSSL
jgi:hypothetical protein